MAMDATVNPKISVIIPSYNHAKFIGEAIQSVLNQTFKDFELLICDDFSTDSSLEIINSFKDSRIKVYSNLSNMGASYTVNSMITIARGEYVAILNSDDIWMLNKLEIQANFLDSTPQIAAVFTNVKIIDQEGKDFDQIDHFYYSIFNQENRSRAEWLKRFFYEGNCLCHPSLLIRKVVYGEVGLYNPLMAALADFEMWVRICLKYDIHILEDQLIKFRILDNHSNSSAKNSRTFSRIFFDWYLVIVSYSQIDCIDFFNNIFDAVVTSKKEMEIVFALKCLRSSNISLVLWAIQQINRLLDEDEAYYSQFLDYQEVIRIEENVFVNNHEFLDIFCADFANKLLEGEGAKLRDKISLMDLLNKGLESELDKFRGEVSLLGAEIFSYQHKLLTLEGEIKNIMNSRSWKLTKPLRALYNFFARMF